MLMQAFTSGQVPERPGGPRINGVLRALRDGFPTSDPYEFLQILGSKWAMQFSWAERSHAFEVVDRMLNVRAMKPRAPKTITVSLPHRFYDDHVGRDLPSGTELARNKSRVIVELDRAGFTDLLNDAEFYVHMGVAEFGREFIGLISSARATRNILLAWPEYARP